MDTRIASLRYASWPVFALGFGAFLLSVWFLSLRVSERALSQALSADATLVSASLSAALTRFDHLGPILAQDPAIARFDQGPPERLNGKLKDAAEFSALEAIYIMDPSGLTVAASNFEADLTFLGKNYGFRRYFREALAGEQARYFAIGATTARPGFFLATPIRNGTSGEISGVLALKDDLSDVTSTWGDNRDPILVVNQDGIVVLASNSAWLYRSVSQLSDADRSAIERSKQFAGQPLAPLAWELSTDEVLLEGQSYLQASHKMPVLGWTLFVLQSKGDARATALRNVVLAMFATALLAMALGIVRSRRVRRALAESQAERRQLSRMNIALEQEIEDRRAAEVRLERAQADLARSSKLAALGQLAASVTHELGQPLSAMKNHLAAADIAASSDTGLISKLSGLVTRMEGIATELRFFAKPGKPTMERIDLRKVWKGAYELTEAEISAKGVKLETDLPNGPLWVDGNLLRLEQVVVNLVKNALRAMSDTDQPNLKIRIGTPAFVSVRDTGPGLNGASIENLREPFFTTRASGTGLGLGLAISAQIAAEHNGQLKSVDHKDGAEFVLSLPAASATPSNEG